MAAPQHDVVTQTDTQIKEPTIIKEQRATARLLESYCVDAIESLNNRDCVQAFHKTSPDFIHDYTLPSGQIHQLNVSETISLYQEKFVLEPDYRFDITSVDAQLNEEISDKYGRRYATVWMNAVVKDGEEGVPGMRERVAIFSWRREVDGRWVWWRIVCPCTANIMPG